MILADVNVLVYAHRVEAKLHDAYHAWLEDTIYGDQAYGFSELILSGFVRIVTHPRIFTTPTDLGTALAFSEMVRRQPNAVEIAPGARHWDIFVGLCQVAAVKGNLVPVAYLAAIAIESGSEWITADRDYSRFPSLKWRHPLD
jgi:toxin-antitoxin system PIN domain toxin